jgi:pimeloyl-ACP methyl ester carboxylesterase
MAATDRGFNTVSVNRREILGASAALALTSGAVTRAVGAAHGAVCVEHGAVGAAHGAELPVPVAIVPVPAQAPVVEGLLDVGGARLWYWDTGGKGEAVVLLHPATGSGASWGYQQPVFSQAGYRVTGYSRRGHFKSEATGSDGSAADDVGDLQKLADHLGLQRFHLVGSAAGTILAAQFAVAYPQRLSSVVLGSSFIDIADGEYQALIARLLPPGFASLSPEFRELGPSYRAANPVGTEQWIQLEKTSRSAPQGPPPARRAPEGNSAVTFASLAALTTPTLLLTGDCDSYASPAVLVYVAGKLGKRDVVIIENAGHAAFWEQPRAYNTAVLGFIRQHRGAQNQLS